MIGLLLTAMAGLLMLVWALGAMAFAIAAAWYVVRFAGWLAKGQAGTPVVVVRRR